MLFSYAWKELTRRKTRTALSVLGIFFSIALLVAVLAISDFFKQAMLLPFKAAGADMLVETFTEPGPWNRVRLARHLGPIPQDVLAKIKNLPGVENVAGQLLFWAWHPPQMINVAGVDVTNPYMGPITLQTALHEAGKRCCAIAGGRPFKSTDKYAAILDKQYADKLNLKVGDKIPLAYDEFEVIGIADLVGLVRVAQAEIFIPLSVAQETVARGQGIDKNSVNLILVKLKSLEAAKEVEKKVKNLVAAAAGVGPQQVKVFTAETILPDTTGVSTMTQSMIKVISIIMLVGIALLVIKASLISVAERVGEIGVMKAIGWRDSEVSKLITIESALQGLIGGVLGCLLGYFVAFLYALTAEFKLPHGVVPYSCVPAAAPPANLKMALGISWSLVIAALVIAVGIGVLGGYIASRRAAALEPARALRQI